MTRLSSILSFVTWLPCIHAADWTYLYEKDGIVVESKTENNLPTFRARGIIDLNFYDIYVVLSDLERRPEWIENLAEISIISGDVDSHLIVYNRFDLPFPASDRDSVVEAYVHHHRDRKEAEILFQAAPENLVAEKKSVVRVRRVGGKTWLRYIDEKRSEISEQISMDPGGFLPHWVARIFIEDVPVKLSKD